jgi:hypothetical protein
MKCKSFFTQKENKKMIDSRTEELMKMTEKHNAKLLLLDLEKIIKLKGDVSPEFMLQVAQNAKEVIRNIQQ